MCVLARTNFDQLLWLAVFGHDGANEQDGTPFLARQATWCCWQSCMNKALPTYKSKLSFFVFIAFSSSSPPSLPYTSVNDCAHIVTLCWVISLSNTCLHLLPRHVTNFKVISWCSGVTQCMSCCSSHVPAFKDVREWHSEDKCQYRMPCACVWSHVLQYKVMCRA